MLVTAECSCTAHGPDRCRPAGDIRSAGCPRTVRNEIKTTIRRLKVAIVDALKQEGVNEDRAASLAAFIISAYFGSRTLARGGAPTAMIGDTRDHCLQLLP